MKNDYVSYGEKELLLRKMDKTITIWSTISLVLLIATLVFCIFQLPAYVIIRRIVYGICALYYLFQMVYNTMLSHFAEPIEKDFVPALQLSDFVYGFSSAIEGRAAYEKYYEAAKESNRLANEWSIRYCRNHIKHCKSASWLYALFAFWFIFCIFI